MSMARSENPAARRCADVLTAALSGGEDDVRQALAALDISELSRLRNAMHTVAELAERRRKQLWRNR